MGQGVSVYRVLAVIALFVVLAAGLWPGDEGRGQSGQPSEEPPPAPPDPAITDLSFELFLDTTVIVTISITNLGEQASSGGSGELLVRGPEDEAPHSVGLFFFGAVEPGAVTRAGGQFSIAQTPDGPYTVTARITSSPGDGNPDNNAFVESFTLVREPQLRPVRIDFAPPFFNPELVSRVTVRAFVDNFGLQPGSGADTVVDVEFAYCRVQDPTEACSEDAFTVFAGRQLDLLAPDTLPSGRFVIDPQKELRVREWIVEACLPLVPLSDPASQNCPATSARLEPGIYIVRVRVDPDNVLAEADENDNVAFARFTIPGQSRGILDLVVGINGEQARGMLFYRADDAQIVGVDKLEFERIATCVGVRLQSRCPYEDDAQAMNLIRQFTQVTPNPQRSGLGTVRLDVFSSAFAAFDRQVNKLILFQEDVRPARITAVVQNRARQVLYVGLSDGRLLRLNFSNPLALQRNLLTVDSSGEVAALQVIDNGVYVGINSPNSTDPNAQGRVYFVQDKNGLTISTPQVLPAGNRIRELEISPSATTVFVTTFQENRLDQGRLQLWWASNVIQSGQLTGVLTPLRRVSLPGFDGTAWDDLVVNNRLRGFLSVRDQTGNSQLYGYRFRKMSVNGQSELEATRLFGPVGELIDQCDARTVQLGQVRALALGDDTPDVSGDQVLHVATVDNPRVLTLQIQRKNPDTKIIEDVVNLSDNDLDNDDLNRLLHWWVPIESAPVGVVPQEVLFGLGRRREDGTVLRSNGFVYLPAEEAVFVVDGQNREPCTAKAAAARLDTGAIVATGLDAASTTDLDPITFEQIPGVIAFYAADGIYIWRAQLNDL